MRQAILRNKANQERARAGVAWSLMSTNRVVGGLEGGWRRAVSG